MSWDGEERRKNHFQETERDRLLTQIDTKLTIFLEAFDKHVLQDKDDFSKMNIRVANLEKIGYGAVAIVVAVQILLKWIK